MMGALALPGPRVIRLHLSTVCWRRHNWQVALNESFTTRRSEWVLVCGLRQTYLQTGWDWLGQGIKKFLILIESFVFVVFYNEIKC